MQRHIKFFGWTLVILVLSSSGWTQVNSQTAFQTGQTAYKEGQFTEARDQFLKASQTDNNNPEVFLWLGKSEYQLGAIDKAMTAWGRTVKLAPSEPYAKKMLDVLRGQVLEAEARIRLIEVLIKEKLYKSAQREAGGLMADKSLTDGQRVKVMIQQAKITLGQGHEDETRKIIQELWIQYPMLDDRAQTTLLMGRAKIKSSGPIEKEGLKLLQKVVTDFAGTESAIEAEYELIIHGLRQKTDTIQAKKLDDWVTAHISHPNAQAAREQLVDTYLTLTKKEGNPTAQSGLSQWDKAALALVEDLLPSIVRTDQKIKLIKKLIMHLDGHYGKNKSYNAAIQGNMKLLKTDLPPNGRLAVLKALGGYQKELALTEISIQAKAGQLTSGKMPKSLTETLATYKTINQEFPNSAAWGSQADLAERLRKLAALTPWPTTITKPMVLHTWAEQIALEVIKADGDVKASDQARKVIGDVVADLVKHEKLPARGLSLDVHTRLLAILKPTHSTWPVWMLHQADLLSKYATATFNENIQIGQPQANAVLNEYQIQMLKTLATLMASDVNQGPTALQKLDAHLSLCMKHNHYNAVEQAYAQLAISLPQEQQRAVTLKIAQLLIQQTKEEHQRLMAAGLTVPRTLDLKLTRAQSLCRTLQEGLLPEDPFLQHVRSVWDGIIDHYIKLDYDDIAEQALTIKYAQAITPADVYTQWQRANLKLTLARKELAQQLKHYKGDETITLTPAFKTAIASYQQFIAMNSDSPLRSQAIACLFSIGELFEQYKAYDIAVAIYRDFTSFSTDIKPLWQAGPRTSSPRQRAAFAVALALDAKAKTALAKATSDLKKDADPPAAISQEYAVALGAYKEFIKNDPQSILVAQAVGKIMNIAMEYAKKDSWLVADAVYLELLDKTLSIRYVERIEFCRGLTQLGQVIPEHARELLSKLTLGTTPPTKAAGDKRPAPAPTTLSPAGIMHGYAAGSGRALNERFDELDESAAEINAGDYKFDNDSLVVASIAQHEASRAAQVARMRESLTRRQNAPEQSTSQQGAMMSQKKEQQMVSLQDGQSQTAFQFQRPVLSEAELTRQQKALDQAYTIFQAIRQQYPISATAGQARGEIQIMISHWRTLQQWQRAAQLAKTFLADNPTDPDLPNIRLSIARDYLARASQTIEDKSSRQAMLAEVAKRYTEARKELRKIPVDFPDERSLRHDAQWDIANSFLTQARVVNNFSATLARGQYVRAARELQHLAEEYYDHPKIGAIPQMQWDISQELSMRGYHKEAVGVWHNLMIWHPGHDLAQQASLRIAQTYRINLRQPLQAAMAYQDVNIARGGNDVSIQNEIYQIGVQLKQEKRWVEALHILGMFVDSFPRHGQAGQAISMIGQIHQTNEAWQDAIVAYQRVMTEFPQGNWVKEAKWSIAECTINLSQWPKAADAYRAYLKDYPNDDRTAEINRRIGILKDLIRYQALVDENGQRKAFDAQYQIADIILKQLSNRVKAIIEFRKVAKNWPKSHLADDALYAVGTAYLAMGETDKARSALREVAIQYPGSPLSDDALFMVGKSFENEANRLATATRAQTVELNREIAQKQAYLNVQNANIIMRAKNKKLISSLRKGGSGKKADLEEARQAAGDNVFNDALVNMEAVNASQVIEELTAEQMADRQDKINAALRKAVAIYQEASKLAGGDKAGDALQRMAIIYAEQLKDSKAAMAAWLEIVRQFSGTAVAEDASWRIAQYYERQGQYAQAIEAYQSFLRNYRRSPKAGAAQFAIAENNEQLNEWVNAMDAYTNYINNFPQGPMTTKAREQINWIKAYRL